MTDPVTHLLQSIGAAETPDLPLAEAALALATLDLPALDLAPYHVHLSVLAADVAACMAGQPDCLAARANALRTAIVERAGYRGDSETYDDLDNANLVRVIDRRRGLPVALGILYIHAARAQGWTCSGLAFPGHFLIRLEAPDHRAILDPFHDGEAVDAAALRARLRAMAGEPIDLEPKHYAAVDDRAILLRLQNNIKLRRIGTDRPDHAVATVEHMLLFAPQDPDLWREAGLLHAHLGNLHRARAAIEQFLEVATDDIQRHAMAALLQRLDASSG